MELRAYQEKAIQEIRAIYSQGTKKALLHLATGAGKTLCFSYMLKSCHEKGTKAIMVVRGRDLVDQASSRLTREGVSHGVLMAGHEKYDLSCNIQICSIDTLSARHLKPEADFIVIDECLTPDMELLTDKGFIRFDALNKTELVAQFDQETMGISFCDPIRWIEKQVEDINLITIKSDKKIDISMTENHEVLLCDKTKIKKITAKDFNFSYYSMYKSGYATGDDNLLSPYEKLMIAYQADGHDQSLYKAYFTFSKERKIKVFLDLMNEGGFEYKEISGKGSRLNVKAKRRFSVHIESRSKFVDDIFDIKNLSYEKCKFIIEYMVNWDGSIINENTYYFSSVHKRNTDFYQAIACLCGYYTNLIIQHDNRSEKFSSVYRLFIVKNRNKISLQGLKKVYSKYTGKVYCVTVPKGNIIVRRNGKTLVVGNCHLAGSEKFRSFLAHYDKAFILGVTATPYGEADLTHIADAIVSPISIGDLIEQGFLVDARYFGAAEPIDLSDIKITKGDYNEKQLDEKMQDLKLVADVVASYKRLGEDRPALCFAVSIEHSKKLAAQFVENNVSAIHLDATSSREARLKEIGRLESGEIKVICNVGIFTTGVDIPALSCIILARPTKSYNLYIQMLGRGTRCFPGKKDFLVIDHAQAVFEHGFITMPRKVVISKKKRESGAAPIKTCKQCYAICHAAAQTCTQCGEAFPIQEKSKEVNTLDIALSEIKDPIDKMLHKLFLQRQKKNFKPGWIWFQLKERYDEGFAKKLYYKSVIPKYFPELKK